VAELQANAVHEFVGNHVDLSYCEQGPVVGMPGAASDIEHPRLTEFVGCGVPHPNNELLHRLRGAFSVESRDPLELFGDPIYRAPTQLFSL